MPGANNDVIFFAIKLRELLYHYGKICNRMLYTYVSNSFRYEEEITMQLAPYLVFDGNCREVMNFYAQCFEGLLELVTYGECPTDDTIYCKSASGSQEDIIYSAVRDPNSLLPFITASDLAFGSTAPISNGPITIDCINNEQIEHLFQLLSQEGTIIQPLTNVFWSARIGKIVDKYGVSWFLNYQVD